MLLSKIEREGIDAKKEIEPSFLVLLLLVILVLVCACSNHQNEFSRIEYKQRYLDEFADSSLQKNPIIHGFNPDPCIIRVKNDYYIATSSFEWFPAVPLYHSKDLIHWEKIGHAITRVSQADLRGIPNSAGIYAPNLRYHNGRYYVLYTIVNGNFPFNATPNYIIWSDSINGEYSDPVYLNSTGFDPALFFDDDGKCYYMNMTLDFYHEKITGGIMLQEIDIETLALKGKSKIIFEGTKHGTEGPHIFKRGDFYYLLVAEGGTDWGHQVTVARSKNIWGPYEVHPENPILTTKDDPQYPLQRAGHASIVETQNGDWFIAYLASRPLMPERKSVLGRESCLEQVVWKNDWIYLAQEGNKPHVTIGHTNLVEQAVKQPILKDDFNEDKLDVIYQTVRQPFDSSWLSLTQKPGYLSLKGRKPFNNFNDQSLIARPLTSLFGSAETCLEFDPESYRQMAGLICYYDTRDFIYLKVSYDEGVGKTISITHQTEHSNTEPYPGIAINDWKKIYLKTVFDYDSLQFMYSRDGQEWVKYGKPFYSGQLSDENNKYGFTGTMIGICAQDMVYENKYAYFDYFTYSPLEE